MTQRFCRAIAQDSGITELADVDHLCERLFLSTKAREEDDNLVFVRKWMLSNEPHRAGLLRLYDQIRQRPRKIKEDDPNALLSILRLTGIVRASDSVLSLRNRIYAHVFDRDWVRNYLGDLS